MSFYDPALEDQCRLKTAASVTKSAIKNFTSGAIFAPESIAAQRTPDLHLQTLEKAATLTRMNCGNWIVTYMLSVLWIEYYRQSADRRERENVSENWYDSTLEVVLVHRNSKSPLKHLLKFPHCTQEWITQSLCRSDFIAKRFYERTNREELFTVVLSESSQTALTLAATFKFSAIQSLAVLYSSSSPIMYKVSMASTIVAPNFAFPKMDGLWPRFVTGRSSLAPQAYLT